ncbi:lipoprotein [Lysinibacillus sp. NPDC097231]|uniref:lipoprotein n=1 Tax=Lysinibacillus sp. NPDC097231 TaxID=3364142 RepID=UPI003814C360
MKKIILLILIVTLLSGCNGFLNDIVSQPEGKVIVNGEQYTMIPSNFEWDEGDVKIKEMRPRDLNELADDFETIDVEKKDILDLEIEKNPYSITITKQNEDGTIDNVEINDFKITMPSKEGYYIYKLNVTWDKGKETFVFDVNVK